MSDTDFLRLILADPEADSPRLVYADWLDGKRRCGQGGVCPGSVRACTNRGGGSAASDISRARAGASRTESRFLERSAFGLGRRVGIHARVPGTSSHGREVIFGASGGSICRRTSSLLGASGYSKFPGGKSPNRRTSAISRAQDSGEPTGERTAKSIGPVTVSDQFAANS